MHPPSLLQGTGKTTFINNEVQKALQAAGVAAGRDGTVLLHSWVPYNCSFGVSSCVVLCTSVLLRIQTVPLKFRV